MKCSFQHKMIGKNSLSTFPEICHYFRWERKKILLDTFYCHHNYLFLLVSPTWFHHLPDYIMPNRLIAWDGHIAVTWNPLTNGHQVGPNRSCWCYMYQSGQMDFSQVAVVQSVSLFQLFHSPFPSNFVLLHSNLYHFISLIIHSSSVHIDLFLRFIVLFYQLIA